MAAAQLEITGGVDAGQIVELGKKPLTIGRAPGNTLKLNDNTVSRQHAKVFQRSGSFLVLDLHSSHGTWVNGEKVSQHTLQPNDEIKVGKSTFRFKADTGQEKAPAAESTADDDEAAEGGFELDMPAEFDAPATTPDQSTAKTTADPVSSPDPQGLSADGEDPFAGDDELPPLSGQDDAVRAPPSAAGLSGGRGSLYRPSSRQPTATGKSLLHHDLDQHSPAFRYLSMALVIAVAVGLGWVAMKLGGFGTSDDTAAEDEFTEDPKPKGPNRPLLPGEAGN